MFNLRSMRVCSLLFIPSVLAQVTSNCSTGVHIICTRASTEAPGPGIIGAIANRVVAQIPNSDIVSTEYPALLNPYIDSETAGVTALNKLLNDYTTSCPCSKVVLMGYSQGAQVTADVLCGASETNFPTTQGVSECVASKVTAAVLMGDPSFVKGQVWDRGTAQNVSFFPRQNNAGCQFVQNKMVSFCNSNDTFCDSGNNLTVHLSYVQSNGDEAVKFVVDKFNGK